MSVWALTTEALHGQVWRLWTGHIAHYGWLHVALNALAAVPAVTMIPSRDRPRLVLWALIVAPLISCAILMSSFGSEYRGASALVVALWFYAGLRERSPRGNIIVTLAALKVALEMTTPLRLGVVAVAPLPIAHLAGAVAGTVIAFCETTICHAQTWAVDSRRSASSARSSVALHSRPEARATWF